MHRMTPRRRRSLVAITGSLAVGCVLVACGSQPIGNYSQVRMLVGSLAEGRVSGVGAASTTATRQFQSVIKAIGVRPSVALVSLSPGSAQLRWSWPVPGGPWTYGTSVTLSARNGNVWWPRWSPSVVIPEMTSADEIAVTHSRGHRAPILLSDRRPVGSLTLGGLTASIEHADDAILGGVPGTNIMLLRRGGTPVEIASFRPTNGHSLRLTINRAWQQKADAILNQVSPEAALVAIRPSTGAIVASAGNTAAGASDLATWAHSAAGSTWKTVDSLALIRSRHFTPDSIVDCPLHYTLLGFQFKNDMYYPSSALGHIPLKTAVANSCNTAMISQHAHLTYADLKSAAETLGLTVDHQLGFPAYFGRLPPPANEFAKAEDMIGQGDVLVSPMAMATDIATIQRGATVVPWMIQGHRPSRPEGIVPMTAIQDRYLKTIFHQVVLTGTASGLLGVPGGPIIAKTGTAEFIQNGQDVNHTWMIAAQGDLAVCVYFNVGNFGADTSGPLLRQFLLAVAPH
ncbi:MAG: penicillin-binding transpeptidase domain-containing protein [Acidimicrobiales bacterium]